MLCRQINPILKLLRPLLAQRIFFIQPQGPNLKENLGTYWAPKIF